MSETNATPQRTPIDLIRETFGEDLSPDLIVGMDQMSDDQLREFSQRVREWERETKIPPKVEGEVRPFITYQSLQALTVQTGVSLATNRAFTPDSFTHGPMVDLVKRHLLYSHKVTLFDPLPYIADFLPYYESRKQLQNYLAWLTELRPLVEDGTITFLSELGYKDSPGIDVLSARILQGELRSKLEAEILQSNPSTKRIGLPSDLSAGWLLDNTQDSLWEMTHAAKRQPHALDYYFAWPFQIEVLRAFLNTMSDELRPHTEHTFALHNLLTIQVPNLDSLDMADICRIRQNDELFESWRHNLRQALLFASSNQNSMLDPATEKAAIVRQELCERSRELQNDLSSNAWLKKAKAGIKGFMIGGLASTTQAAIVGSDLTTAAISPCTAALASMLWPELSSNTEVLLFNNHPDEEVTG